MEICFPNNNTIKSVVISKELCNDIKLYTASLLPVGWVEKGSY